MKLKLLVTLAVGIVIFFFSNGNWTVPIATWVAPVFLIRFLRTSKPVSGSLILFFAILFSTYAMLFGIIPPFLGIVAIILTIYYAVLTFLPFLLDRLLVPRIGGFLATLIFPATYVATEYIAGLFYGTWNSLAYTQAGNLPLLQIMSVTGLWGVTFLIAWFGSVINWAWEHDFQIEKIRTDAVIYLSVMLAVLAFGGLRLTFDDPGEETVKIATIAGVDESSSYKEALAAAGYSSLFEWAIDDPHSAREMIVRAHDELLEITREVSGTDAEIIVWPEGMVLVATEDEPALIDKAAQIAREKKIYIKLAYFMFPENYPEQFGNNKAVFLGPSGNVIWHYDKAYPVPGATHVAGDGIIPVHESEFGKLSTAICYDMDFPGFINQTGKLGTDIMLVPAWDWREIDPLHTDMAIYRAIENGFTLVRSTGEGLSVVVDRTGRVLAASDYFTKNDGVMTAHAPIDGTWTIYSLIGDLFAQLCVIVVIGFVTFAFTRKK